VGTVTDGAVRDVDEMHNAGFKALARRLCVGHAHSCPVQWGVEVEVFGRAVSPGDLIHADKHGFLAIPVEDQPKVLGAATDLDALECDTVIAAARSTSGLSTEGMLEAFHEAALRFRNGVDTRFDKRQAEW
jgi:regulator of RNase E activity RraA